MKNYIVQAIVEFDDYEGREIKVENPRIKRKVNDLFNCEKERAEYLIERGLVVLKGINKVPEETKQPEIKQDSVETKKTTTKRTKKK